MSARRGLSDSQWEVVAWLLRRGHRAIDVADKVYPGRVTAGAIYNKNSKVLRIPLRRSKRRGAHCPGCGLVRAAPANARGPLCVPCLSERRRTSAQRAGLARRGPNHHGWKGGAAAALPRFTPEYRAWRKAVFERDDYTCQFCGVRGVRLNADHIEPQSKVPERRHDLDNGRTLCIPCHRSTPTYGNGAKTWQSGG